MKIKSIKIQQVNSTFAIIAFLLLGRRNIEGSPQKLPNTAGFLRCIEHFSKDFGHLQIVDKEVQSLCKTYFQEMAGKTSQEITQDPTSYFHSLHRLALSEMYVARKKRSTFRRVRKEIRSLSMAERKDLFRAINDLKEDTSVFPNVYDSFANLHSGRILRSAYQGPNFLGWNRYYLYLFETALRSKNPKIVLPYWDSTLDFNMNDPSYTIMFSSEFMGNVDHTGALDSGPFKNWGIIRDIGQVGSLMSDELLDSILKNPRIIHHDQIVENGPGSSVHTIEGQQYNVHSWVGGMMADMKSSPKDPVFFFHRCFVDLVWELFREKQMSHGVDPESDYPNMGGLFHAPDRPMDGFPWVKNIDGYSNNFTDFIYQYDKRYTCPMCGGSRFLNCVRGKCVSVSTMAVNEAPMAAVSADMNVVNSHVGNFQSPLIMEKLYEITFNDTRIRGHPRPVIIVRNPSDPYLMSEGIVSAASAQIAASEEIRHKLQMKDSSRKRNLKKVPYQSNKMSDGIVKGDSEQEAIKQITPSSNAPKNVASNKVKLDKSLNTSDTSLLSDSSVAGTSTLEAVSEKLPFKEHTKATMDSSGNQSEKSPLSNVIVAGTKMQEEAIDKKQSKNHISKHRNEVNLNNSGNSAYTSLPPDSSLEGTITQEEVTDKKLSKNHINKHRNEVNLDNSGNSAYTPLPPDSSLAGTITQEEVTDKTLSKNHINKHRNEVNLDNSGHPADTSLLSDSSVEDTPTKAVTEKLSSKKHINKHFKETNHAGVRDPLDQIFLSGGIVAPSSAQIAVTKQKPTKFLNHDPSNNVITAKDSFDVTSTGLSQPSFIGSANFVV